jgi:hypothetical protein
MKKLLLGIGIILFAILLKLCSTGMDLLTLVIGAIGLLFVIYGSVSKSD